MRYEPPQKPMQYETYTPMQAHTRYEPRQPQPPSPMRYEQQYRPPPSSSSTRYGSQNENKLPSNGYVLCIRHITYVISFLSISVQQQKNF
jgi:hypothetical protein